MKRIIIILLSLLCPAIASAKVTTKLDAIKNTKLFGIRFSAENAEYFGSVGAVIGVSLQPYYTKAFFVQEMTIEMGASAVQLRIYSTEIIDPKKMQEKAAASTPLKDLLSPSIPIMPTPYTDAVADAEKMMNTIVYKEWPLTTHSRTIEYKLSTHKDVIDLYKQVQAAWAREAPPEGGEDTSSGEWTHYTVTSGGDTTEGETTSEDEKEKEKANEDTKNKLNGTIFTVTDK